MPVANITEQEDSSKSIKVLLAEDDAEDREIFEDALNESGVDAELTTVKNGKELVDNLNDPAIPNPDIVFVDINMPLKSGNEAVAEIKSNEDLKDIPTVMLSTSDNPRGIKESFEAGADLYIEKPTSFRSFVKILQNVFSFHWAGRLLRNAWDRFFVSEKHLHRKDL